MNEKPTREQLLEKAKREYPIGTEFIDWAGEKHKATIEPWFCSDNYISAKEAGSRGIVYMEGGWAEIIPDEKPKKYRLREGQMPIILNAAFQIFDEINWGCRNSAFRENSDAHKAFQEAGVMHWFEEVVEKKTFKVEDLKMGDVIRNKASGNVYIVDDSGTTRIAIRTIQVTNPDEWEVVR